MDKNLQLKGRIYTYSQDVNAGIIKGENRKTYLFARKDWMSSQEPTSDTLVFFKEEGKWARFVRSQEESQSAGQ